MLELVILAINLLESFKMWFHYDFVLAPSETFPFRLFFSFVILSSMSEISLNRDFSEECRDHKYHSSMMCLRDGLLCGILEFKAENHHRRPP